MSAKPSTDARLALERRGDGLAAAPQRRLVAGGNGGGRRQLKSPARDCDGAVACDWSEREAPGIGPAWALLRGLANGIPAATRISTPATAHFLEFLQTLHDERHAADGPRPDPGTGAPIGALGRWTVTQGIEARGAIGFFGRIVMVLRQAFTRPGALRVPSLVRHIYETGITAIPIVSLIAFLISVIVAYLGAQQLSRFGANIFVVDLVTIAMLREMGVLLTAIIVAGRSGSAFAAEIGVMQLNEETDALRAMGMNPIEILVVPRVLALIIALPLLTIIADAMGLAGGGLLVAAESAHSPAAIHEPAARIAGAHDLLGRPRQGAGIRHAHRHGRHIPRHAGARIGPRAGPPDDRGGRPIDLHGHSRRRAVCRSVRENRFLMAATRVNPVDSSARPAQPLWLAGRP